LRIEANIEPRTRAGFERLMTGGSPEELDRGAMSLLRSGYPLAAQHCAHKATAMRQFEAQRQAATAHRDRMVAAQAAQAAALAAQNAQAQALADAAAKMHALAVEKGPQVAAPLPVTQNVQAAPVPGTVPVVSSPGVGAFAPPIGSTPGEGSLPRTRARKRIAESMNGHGPELASDDAALNGEPRELPRPSSEH
jgi:hypothetical protein